jgi:succinyl-CoA synthetase beta subunit
MAIEDVAHDSPEKIFQIHVNLKDGLTDANLKDVPKNLDLAAKADDVREIFRKIYKLAIEKDADMVEINPMVLLKDNTLMAIDAKVTIDDNAFFR